MVVIISKNIEYERSERHRFARVTSFLVALNVMAFYYYGVRAVLVSAISVSVSLITEYICCKARGRSFDFRDTSPIMSGMLLALLLPASVPYKIVVFAGVFMIAVCKHAFGGNDNLIFSPVALAYAFISLTWPNSILRYPKPVPFGNLSLSSEVPDVLDRSFTYYSDISLSSASALDIIWGKLAGPMGTMSVLIIMICAVSLYFFRDFPAPVFFSAVAANVIIQVIFPFSVTGWDSVLYSFVTGSFMFVLVFMTCDYRFAPKHAFAQTLYGISFAAASYLLRKHCGLDNGAVFALLIVCIFSSEFDRLDVFVTNALTAFGKYIMQKIRAAFIYIKFRTYSEDASLEKPNDGSGEDEAVLEAKADTESGENPDTETKAE